MKGRHYALLILLALCVLAGGIAYYRKTVPVVQPTESAQSGAVQASPTATLGPPRLADFVEKSGVVTKRSGPLRLYVTVEPEIELNKTSANGLPQQSTLSRIPILVVLENDSYQKVDVAMTGDELFAVSVTREEAGTRTEVFSTRQSNSGMTEWQPAERKSYTVWWPASQAVAGDYFVSVTSGFGDQAKIKIPTRLK